jgi:PAS domain S-box-containing protein
MHEIPVQAAVRQRFEAALRAGGFGTWRWDVATGLIEWDASTTELFGFAPGEFDGTFEAYATRIHPQDLPVIQATIEQALRTRAPVYTVEHRIVRPDGELRWFSSTGQLLLDDDGNPSELIGVVADVTGRRTAETERASAVRAEGEARTAMREAQRRLATLLDAPLELTAMLQQVAELAVEQIADWCTVDVVGRGRVHHAAVAHSDPAMVALARELQRRYPTDLDDPVIEHLLSSREPMHVPELTSEMLAQTARDAEHLELLLSLDIGSYVAVPLVAGEVSVGTMLLASGPQRPLTTSDVELAVELGRRAGAAVQKARLHEDLSSIAQTLQESLLPPQLPLIPDVHMSAHYRSGTEGMAIGGDFYDVFRTTADRWWVVLGDVCGKGASAAALAAAVRYSVRAIAPDTDDPEVLVRRLNDVLLGGDWGEQFTTLVCVTFLAPPSRQDGVSDEAPLELSVVHGGHPFALLRARDGEVSTVNGTGTLVGSVPDLELDVVTVTLRGGDTLLLYTDGATEARDVSGAELGTQTLTALLAGCPPEDGSGTMASRLAGLLAARASGGFRDDLALLTLTRALPR